MDAACLWTGFNVFVLAMLALDLSPYRLDTILSFGVVVGILAVSVVASLLRPKKTCPVGQCLRGALV